VASPRSGLGSTCSSHFCRTLFLRLVQMRSHVELDPPDCETWIIMQICCFCWASKSRKIFSFRGRGFAPCHCTSLGDSLPDPRYRVTLRTRHACSPHIFRPDYALWLRACENCTEYSNSVNLQTIIKQIKALFYP